MPYICVIITSIMLNMIEFKVKFGIIQGQMMLTFEKFFDNSLISHFFCQKKWLNRQKLPGIIFYFIINN